MSLLALPDHVLARINFLTESVLYTVDPFFCKRVRDTVTSVKIGFLYHPEQLHIYPKLKRVSVDSVDLVSFSLGDYLPFSVTALSIANKVPTPSLLRSIPPHVVDVEIGIEAPTRAFDTFEHRSHSLSAHCMDVIERGRLSDLHPNVIRVHITGLVYPPLTWNAVESLRDESAILLDHVPHSVTDVLCHRLGEVHEYMRSIVACEVRGLVGEKTSTLVLSRLPPQLERLEIECITSVLVDVPALPPTLRQLDLCNVTPTAELSQLIAKSNIRVLSLYSCNPAVYCALPALEELYLGETSKKVTNDPLSYPKTLKKLKTTGLEIEHVGRLPDRLEWLYVTSVEPNLSLPRTLRVLVTSRVSWAYYFMDQALPVLERLTLIGSLDVTFCARNFPPSLTALDFSSHYVSLNGLPASLRHLDTPQFENCGSLPNLRSLTTLRCKDVLPSTLRDLRIYDRGLTLPDHLPPKLTSMTLEDLRETTLLSLPVSLGSLSLHLRNDPRTEERHPALRYHRG